MMLNRWKCWTVELKTETLTKFEIETWAWVEREKQIHTQYVCRRLCDFIHITHMTLCNIKLSSFSLQQINAYTICLNVQQELTTYSSTFSVMFVCICIQVTLMRHSFVIRSCRTVACIKIDSTKEEMCVCLHLWKNLPDAGVL